MVIRSGIPITKQTGWTSSPIQLMELVPFHAEERLPRFETSCLERLSLNSMRRTGRPYIDAAFRPMEDLLPVRLIRSYTSGTSPQNLASLGAWSATPIPSLSSHFPLPLFPDLETNPSSSGIAAAFCRTRQRLTTQVGYMVLRRSRPSICSLVMARLSPVTILGWSTPGTSRREDARHPPRLRPREFEIRTWWTIH